MTLLNKLKDIDLVLGSQSPRRKQLLEGMNLTFVVEVKEVDEHIDRSLDAKEVVLSIAKSKLQRFLNGQYNEKLVIVADTIVADKDGYVLGKPENESEAVHVLRHLAGQSHYVYTAVGISFKGYVKYFVEKTKVTFCNFDEEDICYYVNQYKPMDKAGSYGIQEWIGMIGVARIEGSYENVLGLPTARLYQELKNIDW